MSSASLFGRTARTRRDRRPEVGLAARAICVALAVVALAWGCGGAGATDVTQQPVNLVGVRTLRTVGGSALPYDIPSTAGRSPGDTYHAYAASLQLSAGLGNHGFRDSTRYTSAGGFSSYNLNGDDGYVTQSGTTLTLKSGRTSAIVTATLVGTSLHATRDAVDYGYTR
jgi:hypothetical protein